MVSAPSDNAYRLKCCIPKENRKNNITGRTPHIASLPPAPYPNLAATVNKKSSLIISGNGWGQNYFFWKDRTNPLSDKVIMGRPLYLAALAGHFARNAYGWLYVKPGLDLKMPSNES